MVPCNIFQGDQKEKSVNSSEIFKHLIFLGMCFVQNPNWPVDNSPSLAWFCQDATDADGSSSDAKVRRHWSFPKGVPYFKHLEAVFFFGWLKGKLREFSSFEFFNHLHTRKTRFPRTSHFFDPASDSPKICIKIIKIITCGPRWLSKNWAWHASLVDA